MRTVVIGCCVTGMWFPLRNSSTGDEVASVSWLWHQVSWRYRSSGLASKIVAYGGFAVRCMCYPPGQVWYLATISAGQPGKGNLFQSSVSWSQAQVSQVSDRCGGAIDGERVVRGNREQYYLCGAFVTLSPCFSFTVTMAFWTSLSLWSSLERELRHEPEWDSDSDYDSESEIDTRPSSQGDTKPPTRGKDITALPQVPDPVLTALPSCSNTRNSLTALPTASNTPRTLSVLPSHSTTPRVSQRPSLSGDSTLDGGRNETWQSVGTTGPSTPMTFRQRARGWLHGIYGNEPAGPLITTLINEPSASYPKGWKLILLLLSGALPYVVVCLRKYLLLGIEKLTCCNRPSLTIPSSVRKTGYTWYHD